MNWRQSRSMDRPAYVWENNNTYYVRRNIELKKAEDENGVFYYYAYEEAKLTEKEYLSYLGEQVNQVQEDNLTLMEAFADLYEMMEV